MNFDISIEEFLREAFLLRYPLLFTCFFEYVNI